VREIPVGQKYVAIVDDEDYACMSQFNWVPFPHRRKDGSIRNVYAQRLRYREDGQRRTQLMHRFLLSITDRSVQVDHHDHNGLHNWKGNLRICSAKQNRQNTAIPCNNTSGYKGVSWNKGRNVWEARLCVGGVRLFLGAFDNVRDGAAAYNAAAIKHYGEFAYLNVLQE
jgi:hypothetical protein